MAQKASPSFTIASILAAVAAIASFFQGATLGLLLALVAIVFGLIGVVLSLSARKRGGIVSFTAVIIGGIGIVAAIIKALIYLIG
ncbi:hypothetical protein [Haloferula sargassicola]|uniref:DUF4190 domain-containing protein n=1 Tax=Haloferula sargassicola TaxID=490096 RepID=A0ABP9UHY8_9BACT